MSENFDPYLNWLGIRSGGRKVNHYRLLGLELFEADSELIRVAANRLISHVESFIDKRPAESQKLANELTAARNCLLSEEHKQVYDHKLLAFIKTNQTERPGIDRDADGQPVVSPDRPPQPDSTAPDFSGIVAESHTTTGGQAAAPIIKSRQRQKRKSRAFYDIAGWILGGLGAVGFAYVLLNTDLIDRIRGRQPVVMEQKNQAPVMPVQPEIEKQPVLPNPAITRPVITRPTEPLDSDPAIKPIQQTPSDNQPDLPIVQTQPVKATIQRQPLPAAELLERAKREIGVEFKTELTSDNGNIKKASVRSMLIRVDDEVIPERRYALMVTAVRLAAQSRDVNLIGRSIQKLKQHFKGLDFWQDIERPVGRAIDKTQPLELVKRDVESLLRMAEADERWQVCGILANDAADMASRAGDALQHDLLKMYAKDVRGLTNLKKRYQLLASRSDEQFSPKESMEFGKYLCFGKQNWKHGLLRLSKGSDSGLATVAKLDMDSAGDLESAFEIAEKWAALSSKSKYKGTDRRYMLGRALDLLGESDVPNSQRQQAVDSIEQQIALFKNYTNLSELMQSSIEFAVQGWATFDRAMLDNGSTLKLGLNSNVRDIRLRRAGDHLAGTTIDRRIRFEIRALQYGAVEMKMFESGTNSLRNVLYGK